MGDPNTKPSLPWTVGYLYVSPTSPWTFGGDLAGEGVSLDNTSGQNNTVRQGLSFNVLAGPHIRLGDQFSAGVAALLGGRQTGQRCDESYLGYQCYADQAPSVSYGLNYGAVAHLSFKNVLLGARRTGESAQLLVGVSF